MQYELYSKDEQSGFYYHMSADAIKYILIYIADNNDNRQFVIIDNYDVFPINYRILGFKKEPTLEEHKQLVFECKVQKYIDYYIEQGAEEEKIYALSTDSAKKETDFYFTRINEFSDIYK